MMLLGFPGLGMNAGGEAHWDFAAQFYGFMPL
jgi:hypothetical protein